MEMLIVAFNFDGTERTSVAEIRAKEVPVYVSGWGRAGDFGLIAELNGERIGAAWARRFGPEADTYGHVAPDIPELVSIGVEPRARGLGAGAALFGAVIAALKAQGHGAVSLSVEDGNDRAKAMYVRRGFKPVGRNGDADTMLLEFLTPEDVAAIPIPL